MAFRVAIRDRQSKARIGSLALRHGTVTTPAFMPVGTNASVKAMTNEDLESILVNLILSNAYHLYLRPGREVIERAGGLHRFMSWKHNILTDSGGFQIFSLAPFRKVEEQGVSFRSHIDGSLHRLTPEDVIDVQRVFGSDILMPLDVCTAYGVTEQEARDAVDTTAKWAQRSATAWDQYNDCFTGELFGIIQGNFFKDLRLRSAEGLLAMDFAGYAIGGLSVGEPRGLFLEYLDFSAGLASQDKPLYVMGIGTPEYILEAVERGVDLFDCVFPTRTARNAQAFTLRGTVSLRNKINAYDYGPIDPSCRCRTCRTYTRSYLRHLFKTNEICASILATHHNLSFVQTFMANVRSAIRDGSFLQFKRDFLAGYTGNVA